MSRTLLVLALLLAGSGGAAEPVAPAADAHEIAAADTLGAAAFVRSAGSAASVAWQEGSAHGIRPFTRRPDRPEPAGAFAGTLSARAAACAAQATAHADYATTGALARAGRLSFDTTAPPPFRSI